MYYIIKWIHLKYVLYYKMNSLKVCTTNFKKWIHLKYVLYYKMNSLKVCTIL